MSRRISRTTKPRPSAAPTGKSKQKKDKAKGAGPLPSVLDRIPIEIIDYIFEEYVEMDRSPCELTFVSKLWRSLALGNPRLWTHIDIKSRDGQGGIGVKEWYIFGVPGRIYTMGRKQLCQREDEFVAAIDRAGSLPITLSYINYISLIDIHSLSILRMALTPPFCSRLYKLEIHDLGYTSRDSLGLAVAGPFTALRYVSLTAFYVGWLQTLLLQLDQSAPKLRGVEMRGRIEESAGAYPIWKKLQVLKFDLSLMNFQTVNAILSRSTRLTELSTHSYPLYSRFTDLSSLSDLTTLSLRCSFRELSKLKFPQLQALDLNDASTENSAFIYSLRLPCLITLRIQMSFSSAVLRCLEVPLLRSLDIIYYSRESVEQPFPLSGYPQVTDFRLKTTRKENILVAAVMAVPNAQRIHLINAKPSGAEILDILAVADNGMTCPKLERFILGDPYCPINARKLTLDNSVRDVMAFRKEMNLEYAWFDVYHQARSSKEIRLIQYK